MTNIQIEILKVFGLRLWMLSTRSFTTLVLIRCHYYYPHWSLIAAICVTLPLIGVAFYRIMETINLYVKIAPNIEQVEKDLKNAEVKKKNREFIKRI